MDLFPRVISGFTDRASGVQESRNIFVYVVQHVYQDIEEWYADKEPDEPEEVFAHQENEERDENRKFHIGRNDFRIEIVCFYRVDKRDHDDDSRHDGHSSVGKSDDQDRDRRKERSENRDKSENEYDQSERNDERESIPSMDEADNQKPYDRQHGIDERNDRLCFENESEALRDFSENHRVFPIEKGEIPALYFLEILGNALPVDNEDVTQDERDQEFGQQYSDVFDILEHVFHDLFDIVLIQEVVHRFFDSEIDMEPRFDLGDIPLDYRGNRGNLLPEPLSFFQQLWNETIEQEYNYENERDIDRSDYDIEGKELF